MDEKKMTLGELAGWLDDNDVPYGIDDAGKLTVKGNLMEDFRDWVRACKYTSLPEEFFHVDGALWLERTFITSLGNLASVGWSLDLQETPITSLGNLTSVGWDLTLQGAPITSLDDLPQVGKSLCLDRDQFQLLTREVLRKVKGKIKHRGQTTEEGWFKWVTLSPDELETILAENEQREKLNNTRENDVD